MEFTVIDAEGRKEFIPATSEVDTKIGDFLYKFGASTWDNFRKQSVQVINAMRDKSEMHIDFNWDNLVTYVDKFAAIESRIRQFELKGQRPEFSLPKVPIDAFVQEQIDLNK